MLGAVIWLLLVVSSVPIILALKIAVILLLQIFTGNEFYSKFLKSRSISLVEAASIGFSLGALIWLLFDQLFIALSLPHVGWLVPVFIAAFVRLWGGAKTNQSREYSLPDLDTVAWIVIASMVGISGEWVWPFPFAMLATLVLSIRKLKKINNANYDRSAIGILAITGVATLVTRPSIWWITQSDTHFYQAISTSVAKWGFRDSILTSGYSLKYHWFPYAWTGMVGRISDAPDWVVLTRVGPLVATLCIIALVWTITLRLIENRSAAIVGVFVFAASPVFGDWSLSINLAMFGSYSQHFATIWLLPIVLWMIDVVRGALRAPWALVSIFLVGLVGGKVSHAAVALVAVLGFELVRLFQQQENRRDSIVEALFAIGTVVGVTLYLFGTGGSLTWRPASWVPYLQGDLYDFRGLKLILATTIFLLGMLSLAAVVLVRGMFNNEKINGVYSGIFLAVIAGVFASNFSSGPSGPNGLFFVHSPLIIAYTLVSIVLFKSLDLCFASRSMLRQLAAPVFIGACALLLTYLIPDLNSGSVSATLLRTSKSLAPVVASVLIVSLIFVIKEEAPMRKWRLYSMTLISLVTISLGSFVVKSITEFPKNYRNFESEGDSFIESSELRSLSIWFNENTASSEIYATNYVCQSFRCDSANYSKKSLMSAVVFRRSIVQAPHFSFAFSRLGESTSNDYFFERLSVSVNFAMAPTSADFMMLKKWSVGWYVVDLEVTPSNYWTNSDAKVYENNSYLVIDLNKVKLN
jgi:hypothetical protein